MTDLARLFGACWDQEVARRLEDSPSYTPDQYVATGRASAQYGGKRTEMWWREKGPGMVAAWQEWRSTYGWSVWEVEPGVPAIELELNFQLPNGVPIRAFVDRVMVTPIGEPVIVDIKTGRIPETAEQLGLYRYGIEQVYGVTMDWGYFWHPEKGHGSPQSIEMYTGDYFAEQARMAVAGINAGCFLPKVQMGCGGWCGVAKFCTAVGGTAPPFVNK